MNPIFQKYVKPNSVIYNTTPVTQTSPNPLTGGLHNNISRSQGDWDGRLINCHLEFRKPEHKIPLKAGVDTGEVVLQGRVFYDENQSPIVPTWYKPGGKYVAYVSYIGYGYWYTMEQIESMYATEAKYFGYPLLGIFIRVNSLERPLLTSD